MSQRATEFLVWRAGSSVDWDCTAVEIARELGISTSQVKAICKRRGWEPFGHVEVKSQAIGGAWAADVLIRSDYGGRHA